MQHVHLVPTFILRQFEKKKYRGEFSAISMFVDIDGFTAMTQTLMENGKEGAEVLASSINAVFTPAIDAIFEHGGFVSSFAGDAFTAIFPSDTVSIPTALSASVCLRDLFKDYEEQQTKFGSFKLSVGIGMSHGSVSWGIIPQYLQNSYHFGGMAISNSKESEENAACGEVVVDEKIASLVNGHDEFQFQHKMDDFYTLLSLQKGVQPVSETKESQALHVLQSMFFPEEILNQTGRGEFRDIVSCFISFDVKRDLERGAARVITLAHSFGGYFNKVDICDKEGSMLVLFGAPVNPGNLYNRAMNFALAVKEIPELSVRIGLTYGTAFTGFVGSEMFSEYTALGSVVNLSARLTERKKQPVVFLDEAIARQAESSFEIRELRPGKFKGFPGMIPVYRLLGRRSSAQRSFSSGEMVGRVSELSLLSKRLQSLHERRFGGVVHIYGNPGAGKSRLVNELIERSGLRAVTMQTDSILKKPLNPFSYFFNQFFEQYHSFTHEQKRVAFRNRYQELIERIEDLPVTELAHSEKVRISMELDRIQSIISALVGLFQEGSIYDVIDPSDRSVVTEQAIKEFFKALSLTEPIVLVIEDIQWLDSASSEVFKILARRIENYPIIIIACSRFNDDGSKPELKLDENVPIHSIVLEGLSNNATRELIEYRLGGKVDDELAAYIQNRTAGNPFYTEQFCLYLRENHIISFEQDKYFMVKEPVDIPSDVNMILIARIDRLSAELKETVQIASVLGREFEVQVLTKLISYMRETGDSGIWDGSIVSEVSSLIQKVGDERIWSALTEIRYIFNHALLRDAVYDMQLRTRLRSIHKLAGDAIAGLYPGVETTFADCAFHYEQAEDLRNALEFATRAGEYFRKSVRYDEAFMYFSKALAIAEEMLDNEHPDVAACHSNVGLIYQEKSEFETALQCHKKALAIREEFLGMKDPATADSYSNLGETYLRKGEYDTALKYHKKALSIRIELFCEKDAATAISYSNMGEVYWKKGNFSEALKYHKRALSIREEVLGEKHACTATSYNNIGLVHSDKGDYDTALLFYNKALSVQKELLGEKHPDTAGSYSNIGVIYSKKRDYDTALKLLEKALAVQMELLGEKQWNASTTYNNIGSVHYEKKDHDTALLFYEKALSIQKELLGEKHWYTAISISNIGSVHFDKGDFNRALYFYEKALSIQIEQQGEKHPDSAISYYCIGLVYKHKGINEKALEYFERAFSIQNELLGEMHPNTQKCMQSLIDIYRSTGEAKKADLLSDRLKR